MCHTERNMNIERQHLQELSFDPKNFDLGQI